jgi:hypothetical protein
VHGNDLPPGAAPPLHQTASPHDYTPYHDRWEFEVADFLFRKTQMPGTHIDTLMDLWALSGQDGIAPPFASHSDLYETIDSTPIGGVPWKSFGVAYHGPLPPGDAPPWMSAEYDVWYRDPWDIIRNHISNPDFKNEVDYCAKCIFNENGEREWWNLMDGTWAWIQSVRAYLRLEFHCDSLTWYRI